MVQSNRFLSSNGRILRTGECAHTDKALVSVTINTKNETAHSPNLSLEQFCKVMLHMFPEAREQESKFAKSGGSVKRRRKLILPSGAESVLLDNLDLVPNLEVQFKRLP